jgi:hypothetical protein
MGGGELFPEGMGVQTAAEMVGDEGFRGASEAPRLENEKRQTGNIHRSTAVIT